ncbi:C-type lectin galactose-binding isoform-like [Mytilus edulis]|uniref:C-type lectin galactose-binding isoform-like n=1 Tax=Mytilus edulis TaxID=6550 RepID=UPI0039F121AD
MMKFCCLMVIILCTIHVSTGARLTRNCLASNGRCGRKGVTCDNAFGKEWIKKGRCCNGGPCCKLPPCVPTSCPEGYIMSNDLTASTNCYFFGGDDKQNWINALNICKTKGAYLWAPNTEAEAIAVKSTTGFENHKDIWTGLYSRTSDENFEFVDAGGAFTLDTLPFGNRDQIDNEDCVEIESYSLKWNWDDDSCYDDHQYMCEFPMKTCP